MFKGQKTGKVLGKDDRLFAAIPAKFTLSRSASRPFQAYGRFSAKLARLQAL